MKIALLFPIVLLFACNTSKNSNSQADSMSVDETHADSINLADQTICFQHLDGTSNQDTTYIQLIIEGNKARGIYNHLPYQKDSRKGSFTGTVEDNMVNGIWRFMQEGMQDSLPLKLKLEGDILYQQNYTFSPKDGRQVLTDTAKFSVEFRKTDCK